MLVGEYSAAFGGGGGGIGTTAFHGGSRGNLNHFISDMATTHSNNSLDNPYNPARWNEQRRCCPVCKAFCSIDSVIPIYIHAHATTNVAASSQANREEGVTVQSLSQHQSQYYEEQRLENNNNNNNNGGGDITNSDEPSPLAHLLDPTAANIGLRQRRPLTAQTSNTSINNARQQDDTVLFDSPQQTQRNYENIPSTPIIRNGGDSVVPNRPFPTPTSSSSYTNNNSNLQTSSSAATPILNSSTIGRFRLAYRPPRQSSLMGIVSGLVHSIDNIGVAENQQRTSQSQGTTTRDQTEVPMIHRQDGGLGGIGRASEQSNERNGVQQGDSGTTTGMIGEEDSSLAMAREFLSRLVSRLLHCVT